ncbi:PKD domain-containing protein [Marivirga sp. S37H4]|uniref:PKD domain-containing protein n=1 Tax=Marivirga aurantiaca TaxID=2802615 RepID=A0A934WWT7_9BACT|nr:Ig-like domain-containing protein [Marivirga aurantiaca]MBK6264367.1 PKD domain-containing protein [Marivirga aurantiaca]
MKRIFLIFFTSVTFLFISITVDAQRPPVVAGFTESPSIGCKLNHTVFFTDLSENPDIWLWNFGDGSTSTSKNPIHQYTSAGSFNVSLFVQDTINGDSDEISRIITIGVSTVDFNASSTFGCGPVTSNFTDASSIDGAGSIVSWLWDFGDGTTATEQNPSHTYNTRGTYTVALTITSSLGCTKTRTKTNYIQVIGPDVKFTASHTGDNYTFINATISGAPVVSSLWTFGDGATSTDLNPTHTYTTTGVFDVSLTVQDLDGCSRTLTKTNFVNTISGAFDVSQAIFTGAHERFSVAAEVSGPSSLAFNPDGTKMFVLDEINSFINEYNLSSAYDVSTAVYAGDSERFSVAAQEAAPSSVAFSTNGNKMFVMGFGGDDINEYHLATAFDISTAVYAGDSERFSVAAQDTHSNSLTFDQDGTKMYMVGSDDDEVNEYTLSAAFDVSTAVYQTTLSVGAQDGSPQSIAFVGNGFKLLMMGSAGDNINLYNLTTAFDISTASYSGDAERLSIAGQESQPTSFAFNADGTQLYVIGQVGKDINVYSLASPVITGAAANQAVNDTSSISLFSTITIQDPNGDNVLVTITLDDNAKGVLTGTGLSGTGPYTLASTDAASLQASLRTLVFSPTENRTTTSETSTFTLEVSDDSFSDTDNITTVVSSAVAPSVVISSVDTDPINGTFTATFTSSENVTGFEISDITVGNGTASDFTETNASEYTALITPITDGAVTIDVVANVAEDAATNGNTAAAQFSIEADLTLPTVAITSTAPDPTSAAFTATFTFSENVTGFEIGDITVGDGTASDFASTSASVYTALITPTADGTVTVDVATDLAQDVATNGNTAATQFSIEADLTAPTLTITSAAANPTNGAFTATFIFSEEVTGFEVDDITIGNGTASDFASTSASVYTALITPTTDGTVTIDVAANVAQDAATNGNTAAAQFSVEADFTDPTITITSLVADPTNGAFTATFTFSEEVAGFDVTDITVGNGNAGSFAATSASVYTAEITPTSDGTVTIDVAANVAQDAATNGNTAVTQFSIEADLTAPTVSITSAAADPTNAAFTATFTFSENVTGFEIGDILVGNGTASDFIATSASEYTALITPTTDGTVTINMAADVVEDAVTNGNMAADQYSIEADLTAPTLTISTEATDPVNGAFIATFTFSENVTDFEVADISVGNGTAENFASTSASVYTVLITPATDGTVTVDVTADVAQDAATNRNTVATQFSIEADLTAPTLSITSATADPTNAAFMAIFTFSEEVTGFEIGDITVGNGTASDFTEVSASEYTALITPTADGTVIINVTANVAQDAATNGNSAATQFSIEYDGSVAEIICQDITVQLDANGIANIEASQIDNGSSDNYGIASMALDITTFDCSNIGDNEVVLTVTDFNGNTGTCLAVVTVEDTSPPIVVVQDITLPLNTNGQASITVDDIDNGSSDNCGIASRILDVSAFDTPTTPSIMVTLTVTDFSGNTASASATITFGKVAQAILFEPLADKKVGADPVTLQATGGGSGLPVTFSISTEPATGVASIIDNMIIIEGPGMVTVTARQAGNDVFEAAPAVSQTFEIQSNELFLPTLFSPNKDQLNDRFIVRGGGNVDTIELKIFDRDNNLVFSSNSLTDLFQMGWDGEEQPQGVYIWVVKGSFTDGAPVLINGKNTGIIRLIR